MAAPTETARSDDFDRTLRAAVESPAKMSGDAGSVEQRSVDDIIKADRYLAAKEAAKSPGRGLRFARVNLPGAY